METWIPITNYPDYEISDLGKVRCIRPDYKQELKISTMRKGYLGVWLRKHPGDKNEGRDLVTIHKLMATSFLGWDPTKSELQIDHINEDKTDNRLVNLQIITMRKNVSRSMSNLYGTGVSKRGNKFRARINVNKKTIALGTFFTKEEAQRAYQEAVQKYDGNKK
jgi:hypothetical protein